LIVFVSFLAAYAIARIRSRTVRIVFNIFLLGLAIPLHAAIIPSYVIITRMGLYDTLFGLIPAQVAFGIPLIVLILVNFIRDIPNELYASMVLDGAGHVRLLRSLAFPLSCPALITVVVYNTLQVWKKLLVPSDFLGSEPARTSGGWMRSEETRQAILAYVSSPHRRRHRSPQRRQSI
jgi:raffinose/stachyose/melibiose transport system permease protein